jgi:hypothetical protein
MMITSADNTRLELEQSQLPRPYAKPEVQDFGSVQELTEALPGSTDEGGGMQGLRSGMM